MKKIIALSAFAVALTACQSVPTAPVVARADQTFETTGLGKTKAEATENALASAKKQCGLKSPIVIKDSHTYNGVLDEKTDKLINKGVGIFGVLTGNKVPSLSSDDSHEYAISFKCQ